MSNVPSGRLLRCHASELDSASAAEYMGAARACATTSQSWSRGSNAARAALTAAPGDAPSQPVGHHSTSPPSRSPHLFRAPHASSPAGSPGRRAASRVHPGRFGEKHPPASKASTNADAAGTCPPAPTASGPSRREEATEAMSTSVSLNTSSPSA